MKKYQLLTLIVNVLTFHALIANPFFQFNNDVTLNGSNCLDGSFLSFQTNVAVNMIQWYNDGTLVSSGTSSSSISTVAGTGVSGSVANRLNTPGGIFVAANGDVYVADVNNSRIQKWTPGATSGVTVAGGNGAGSAANQLSFPQDVFLDAAGNIYVADRGNNRIQRWAPGATSGVKVAGGNGSGSGSNQFSNPMGVFVDAAGFIYVADPFNNRVQKWAAGATSGVTVAGGNGAGAGNNQLNFPIDLYVNDNGDLFILDKNNNRVQKWAAGATSGVTVAGGNGKGAALNQLNLPNALHVDAVGNIYIADSGNHRVVRWNNGATTGVFMAGGAGTAADKMNGPGGIVVQNQNLFYVSDTYNHRVQKFVLNNNQFQPTTAGNYHVVVTDANGVSYTSNTLTVNALPAVSIGGANYNCNGQNIQLSASGAVSYLWSNGETNSTISVAPTQNTTYKVTVTDINSCKNSANKLIEARVFTTSISGGNNFCEGETINLKALNGVSFLWSNGATTATNSFAAMTNATYNLTVTGSNTCSISLNHTINVSPAPLISLSGPNCVNGTGFSVNTANGNLIRWYRNNQRIARNSDYIFSTIFGENYTGTSLSALNNAAGICSDAQGNVYIADVYNHRILKVEPGSTVATIVAGGSQGSAANQLNYPNDVAIDAQGNLYIADTYNHRIQKWAIGATSGVTVAGITGQVGSSSTELYYPDAVAVSSNGDIYIADTYNHRIQKWAIGATSGVTVAGITGQSGTANNMLYYPRGLDLDEQNNLYIADNQNDRIQKWPPNATSGQTIIAVESPQFIALDKAKNLYVTNSDSISFYDKFSNRINSLKTSYGYRGICTSANPFVYYVANNSALTKIQYNNADFIPTQGGDYIATVQNLGGCLGVSNTIALNQHVFGEKAICMGKSATLTATGGQQYLWTTGETTASITVSPQINTTYQVSIVDTQNCISVLSHSITVNPLPSYTPIISGPNQICAGNIANLYVNNSSYTNYFWSNGATNYSINVTPIYPTIYSVTVSNQFGCTAVSAPFLVNAILLDSVSISATKDTICSGSSITLSSTCAAQYNWSTGTFQQQINVSPTVTTTYFLTVTNALNNSYSTSKTIYVLPIPTAQLNSSECLDNIPLTVSTNCPTCSKEWYQDGTRVNQKEILAAANNNISFGYIGGFCLDANNDFYIADYYGKKITKWQRGASSGTVLSLTSPIASSISPHTIIVAPNGDIYFSDPVKSAIYKFNPNDNQLIVIAGNNGVGNAADQLNSPKGIFITPNGDLYIADEGNDRIQKWAIGATSGETVVGNTLNHNIIINNPSTVFIDNENNIYFSNDSYQVLRKNPMSNNLNFIHNSFSNIIKIHLDNQKNLYISTNSSDLLRVNLNSTQEYQIADANDFLFSPSNELIIRTSDNNGTLEKIIPITTNQFTPQNNGNYYAVVFNAIGCSKQSNTIYKYPKADPSISGPLQICAGKTAILIAGSYSVQWNTGSTFQSITVSPTVTTTYSVTATNNWGYCPTVGTHTVEVISETAKITGNSAICEGEKTNLFGSCANAYLWSNGSTTEYIEVNPSQTTTYSLTTTNTNGITSTANFLLEVHPKPILTLQGTKCFDNTPITVQSNSSLLSTQWLLNNNLSYFVEDLFLKRYGSPLTGINNTAIEGYFIDANDNIYIADTYNHRILKWAKNSNTSTIVAGGNGYGSNDNQLSSPTKIFVTANGDLYVLDAGNYRVQKWAVGATSGVTVAGGNGSGSAINKLLSPNAIFVDSQGAVYVSDNAARVVKWNVGATSGILVAGTGVSGNASNQLYDPKGIYVNAQGDLYIADAYNHRIQKWAKGKNFGVTIAGGNGNGTNANQLYYPYHFVIDNQNNLYIVREGKIIKWKEGENTGTTLKLPQTWYSFYHLFYTPHNNQLSFATSNNIFDISPNEGPSYTPLTSSSNVKAYGVDMNGCGAYSNSFLIEDKIYNPYITSSATLCSEQATTLTAYSAPLYKWSNGSTTQSITVNPLTTTTYTVTLSRTGGCSTTLDYTKYVVPSQSASIFGASVICNSSPITLTASCGKSFLWNTGATTQQIEANPTQNTTYSVTILNSQNQPLVATHSVTIGNPPTVSLQGNVCFDGSPLECITNNPNNSIEWYENDRLLSKQRNIAGSDNYGQDRLNGSDGIYKAANGDVYIADSYNHRIVKKAVGSSQFITVAGVNYVSGSDSSLLNMPTDIVLDAQGSLYIVDSENHRIQKWAVGATSGITVAGGNGAGNAANQLNTPHSICLDAQDNLYISDLNNHRVQKWNQGATSGLTIAGTGQPGIMQNQLYEPIGIYLDAQNNLYVADSRNHRIQKWSFGSSSGITVAGDPYGDFDETLDKLFYPNDICLDAKNNLYIADRGNRRIQRWAKDATQGETILNLSSTPIMGIVINSDTSFLFTATNSPFLKEVTISQDKKIIPLKNGKYYVKAIAPNGCSSSSAIFTATEKPKIAISPNQTNVCAGDPVVLTYVENALNPTYLWNNGATDIAITINPTVTTTYNLTVTAQGGCSNQGSYTHVPHIDTMPKIKGANQICVGESTTLSATCGASYLWNTQQTTQTINVSPLQSTTYTVTITSPMGAKNIVSHQLNVVPLPNVTLNAPSCLNGDNIVALSNQPINNIEWHKNGKPLFKTQIYNKVQTANNYVSSLWYPTDVFVDETGNAFVADFYNNRIVKYTPTDTIGQIVAGQNGGGNNANQLSSPLGVQVTSNGDMYIVDRDNYRIQKWAAGATSGITVAGGNGTGDALNQLGIVFNIFVKPNGTIYIGDVGNNRIVKWLPNATSGIVVATYPKNANYPATTTFADLWVDDENNIYIIDRLNQKLLIWKEGTTLPHKTVSLFVSSPRSIFVENDKSILIAEQGGHQVSRWYPPYNDGEVIASREDYGLYEPRAFVRDANGNYWIADSQNDRIIKLTPISSNNTLNPAKGGNYTAVVNNAGCRASSSIFVSELSATIEGKNTLCKGDSTTLTVNTNLNSFVWNNGSTTKSITVAPNATSDYTVIITDDMGCRGVITQKITVNPLPEITLHAPNCATNDDFEPQYTTNYYRDFDIQWYRNNKPITFGPYGNQTGRAYETQDVLVATSGSANNQLYYPRYLRNSGLWVDNQDNIYISDNNNHRVMKWAKDATAGVVVAGGNNKGSQSNQLNSPGGIFIDDNEDVYVADYTNSRVQKWEKGASFGVTVAGVGGRGANLNQLGYPISVLLDSNKNIYVADPDNARIMKYSPGVSSGIVAAGGNGKGTNTNQIMNFENFALDANSNIYLWDYDNKRLQKWSNNGTNVEIVTVPQDFINMQLNSIQIHGNSMYFIGWGIVKWEIGSNVYETLITLDNPNSTVIKSDGSIYSLNYLEPKVTRYAPIDIRQNLPAKYKAVTKDKYFSYCSYTSNEVTIYPPVNGVSLDSTNICLDGKTPLVAITKDTVASIKWFKDNVWLQGEDSLYIIPKESNYYSIEVTTNRGCIMQTNAVRIADDIAPNFDAYSLPSDITLNCNDNIPIPATLTASDNCSDVTLTFIEQKSQSNDMDSCNNASYQIVRTWIAKDFAGNSQSFEQHIVVIDTIPPTIDDAPDDLTILNTTVPKQELLSANDECSSVIVTMKETIERLPLPPCYSYNNKIIRTWIATDACGNSVTTSQVIMAAGQVLLTCPNDKTLNTSSDGANNYNCSSMILASHQLAPLYADVCNLTAYMKYNISGATNLNGLGAIAGSTLNKGVNNITYSTSWNNINQSCSFKVTILDLEAPKIAMTTPSVVLDACGFPSTIPNGYQPTASDNCDIPSLSFTDVTIDVNNCQTQSPLNKYFKRIERTWKATDSSNNTKTMVQNIYLRDKIAPTAKCKNITQSIGNNNITLNASVFNNNSTDNCTIGTALNFTTCIATNNCNFASSVTVSKSMIPSGQTQVILPIRLRVRDACGNENICTSNLTLKKASNLNTDDTTIKAYSSENEESDEQEKSEALSHHGTMRCFPNPFNEDLSIEYFLAQSVSQLKIKVFDNQGRLATQREYAHQEAGYYSSRWLLGELLTPGLYHICLELNGQCVQVERIVLIKFK